jgi:hypothetical protein
MQYLLPTIGHAEHDKLESYSKRRNHRHDEASFHCKERAALEPSKNSDSRKKLKPIFDAPLAGPKFVEHDNLDSPPVCK